jgi:carboxylesterase
MRTDWFESEKHESFVLEGRRGSAMLIHGFMGTPDEMRPLARELNQEDFRVHVPLMPGFGPDIENLGSSGRAQWLGVTEQIWGRLHRAGEADVLIGFSMGGAIALHLARKYPPKRLILLAPLWKLLGGDWKINFLPMFKHVVRNVRPFARSDFNDPEVRRFFAGAMPDIDVDNPDVQKMIRKEVELPTKTLDELRRLASDAGKHAPHIFVPTLVVQGTSDMSVRPRDTRELVTRMISHTRLVEISGEHLLVSDVQPSWFQVRDEVVRFSIGDVT